MSGVSDLAPAATTPVGTDGSEDWEERTLCPDDSCIGVLGPDGRCYICGLRGDLSRPHFFGPPISSPSVEAGADLATAETVTAAESRESQGGQADDGDDFLRRELCPNDSCLGVLSAAGVCPLCGSQR